MFYEYVIHFWGKQFFAPFLLKKPFFYIVKFHVIAKIMKDYEQNFMKLGQLTYFICRNMVFFRIFPKMSFRGGNGLF